jgi:hypothetical protein
LDPFWITRSFSEEMNESLHVDILEGGILPTISSFQKSKSLGYDSPTIEFFLGFFNLIKNDLLKAVQESQRSSMSSFNACKFSFLN